MKEIWTADSAQICTEIHTLIRDQVPLFVYQENFAPRPVFVRKLAERNSTLLLYLAKAEPFDAPHEICFFFYRPMEFATRIFYGTPLDETIGTISVLVPHEILQIQRRKYLHIDTPESSSVCFTSKGNTPGETGRVLDVSLGGALITGPFSPFVKKGGSIVSLSFSLCMNNPRVASFDVHVATAHVVRETKIGNNERKIALTYALNGNDAPDMSNYIELRLMEKKYISHKTPGRKNPV